MPAPDDLRRIAQPAPPQDLAELSIACVGVRFDNPRRKGQPTGTRDMEIRFAVRGDPVELRPEPENKHDQNAIAIYSKEGVQMGYVSADRTVIIRRAWEEGRDVVAVFQERMSWGAWIRVAFDREPTLPAEIERAPSLRPTPDFWPDAEPYEEGVDYIPPDD